MSSTTSFLPKRVFAALMLPPDTGDPEAVDADREAWEEALWLATGAGAELRLCHVIDDAYFDPGMNAAQLDARRAFVDTRLAEYAGASRADGVATDAIVTAGTPWLEVLRQARAWNADLIVVGSRASSGGVIPRLLRGSNSRRLLRKSEIPVWAVRDTGDPPITCVLVCVDFSELSGDLLSLGEVLRERFGLRAHLLHSLPAEAGFYGADPYSANVPVSMAQRERMASSARARLESLLGDSAGRWEVHVGEGPIVADIDHLVETKGVDLVVLGSVSRTGIPGLVVGNTAELVFERVAAPVLVMKPSGWESPVPAD